MITQDRESEDHKLVAFDWSTQMGQLAEVREEWRCCTMGHGVQFVTILGHTMMPELLAGTMSSKYYYGLHLNHSDIDISHE